MNSKHFFFGVLAVAGLAFVSCQSQETDFVDQPEMGDAPEFYAAIEQPSDTKVYADESLMVLWHADDRVSIFNKYTYNNQYAFQGETGANAGVFKKVPSDDFVTGNALPAIYAIYPYAEGTTISNSCEISLTLPAEQPYAELNFGRGANTMVSATEDNDLLFKNLCGYLAVKLYGDGVSVVSVSLKGNNGEKLAGKAVVTAPLDGDPSVALDGSAEEQIRVRCETPVSLGATAENHTEFWFVVPPTTFSQGFTLTVRDRNGRVFEKSTTKEITIERNHLSRMSSFEVVFSNEAAVPEAVDLGLSVKWASFNLGASAPEGYGDFFAWGETTPHYSSQDPLTWKNGYEDGYSWTTYKWSSGSNAELSKYCTDAKYGQNGFMDSKTVLDPEDDAAAVHLGGKWRMPTIFELGELQRSCEWEWTEKEGVVGYKVTGTNGNSIFLPAAGDYYDSFRGYEAVDGIYWTSSVHPVYPYIAYGLDFDNSYVSEGWINYRYLGFSVRPVYGDLIPVQSVELDNAVIEVEVEATVTLNAAVLPSCASNRFVAWSSSDTSVATVNVNGVVTGVAPGTAIITVTTYESGMTATCEVTVTPAVPGAVDLGLSVKWASVNVGAASPSETGDLFAWGEIEPKDDYSWDSYAWRDANGKLTKYNMEAESGQVDGKYFLDTEDDVATVTLGEGWRMPTIDEWDELYDRCSWSWISKDGVEGYQVTGPTGESIFMPGTQQYWSSSLMAGNPWYALGSYSGEFYRYSGSDDRYKGRAVRPVYGAWVPVTGIRVGQSAVYLNVGEEFYDFTVSIAPENASTKAYLLSSSNEAVVSVWHGGHGGGYITGVAPGSATITFTTVDGGYTATCEVTVTPAVPEAVDLGLSVKWASFNVGASAPEGVGNHYAWGETEPKESYTWENYKWWAGSYDVMSKYNPTDGLYALEMEDDVAAVDWGDKWRMPTHKEQEELYNNCDKTLTALNGVSGYRMTSRKNGNSIFLPLDPNVDPDFPMTFYSSRTLSSSGYACSVGMSETSSPYSGYGNARSSGWLIRPVYGDIVPVQSITLDKDAISLAVGDWARIYVSFVPSNASEQNVLWSSSDPTVAPVDQYGQIQPVAAGTATITAKSVDSGRTATCVVTVTPAPEAVDLGLSVKWASFNLGATAPEEYGDYFAWGEVEPKTGYSWSNYQFRSENSINVFMKYVPSNQATYWGGEGAPDGLTTLELCDDAANTLWGEKWRMPTEAECQELLQSCTLSETTKEGVKGFEMTAPNGNSIFLPAAGYRMDYSTSNVGDYGLYWTSSQHSSWYVPRYGMRLYIKSESYYKVIGEMDRYAGLPIRPVTD